MLAQLGAGVRRTAGPVLATSVLRNDDFTRFSGRAPVGWKLTNATAARQPIQVDGATRYAVKLTEVAPTSASVSQALNMSRVRGRWVTVAVRLFVPDGGASVGRVGITDNLTDVSQSVQQGDGPRGMDYWEIVSRKIDPKATTASIVIYVNSDRNQQNEAARTITVKQVIAVLGPVAPLGSGQTVPAGSPREPAEE